MAKNKSKAELNAEVRLFKVHGFGNNVTKVIRDLIMYGSFVGIAYFTYLSIDTLAGKTTAADIKVKAEGTLSLNPEQSKSKTTKTTKDVSKALPTEYKAALFLALLFGIGGIVYGRKQTKLRKDVIERYHPLIQEAEKIIDSKRSTSQLTHRGNTRPEDT